MTKKYALAVSLAFITAGCAVIPSKRPLLTARALNHAAAKCHVEALGLHHSVGGKLPYGDYLIPAAEVDADEDARKSPDCMTRALDRYRYDFLGQVEHRPAG